MSLNCVCSAKKEYQVNFMVSTTTEPTKHHIIANLFEKHMNGDTSALGLVDHIYVQYNDEQIDLTTAREMTENVKLFQELIQSSQNEYRIDGKNVWVIKPKED